MLSLPIKVAGKDTDASRIAARIRKRGDKARSDQIFAGTKNWNFFGRLLCGTNGWVARGNNDVDMGFGNRRSVFRKLLDAQSKTLAVDYEVLPINETIRLHRIEQGDVPWRVAWTKVQITEAINPARLLRARGHRHGSGHNNS